MSRNYVPKTQRPIVGYIRFDEKWTLQRLIEGVWTDCELPEHTLNALTHGVLNRKGEIVPATRYVTVEDGEYFDRFGEGDGNDRVFVKYAECPPPKPSEFKTFPEYLAAAQRFENAKRGRRPPKQEDIANLL